MKIYAIIPARGGSKGLPGKNLRQLGGLPLVARSVAAARSSTLVERVFVSTDDDSIAAAAKEAGAEIIARPADISGDEASSEAALLHGLEYLRSTEGNVPDILVFIQCTSPFTTGADIDGTIKVLLDNAAESALAVVPYHHFIWQQNGNRATGINHDGKNRQRRQDLPPQFLETGSVYAMIVHKFQEEKTRFCGKTVLYNCHDSSRCLEIDTAEDFYMAEAMTKWAKLDKKNRENYQRPLEWSERLKSGLSALICDFDGVFTDNSVYTFQNGQEAVRCDRGDGAGLAKLKKSDLRIVVLSAEHNPVVEARCQKLGIECIQGINDKDVFLDKWLTANSLNWKQIIYVGNDEKDKKCLERAALGIIPSDAYPSLLENNFYILDKKGGRGALREICDKLCEEIKNGKIKLIRSSTSHTCYHIGQKDKREWGTWEVLALAEDFCVKKICVKPSGILSLQYHNFREELWKIIKGDAIIVLGNKKFNGKIGDIIRIDKGQPHRIINKSDKTLVFLEIQTGDEMRESDIVRIEDVYNRI